MVSSRFTPYQKNFKILKDKYYLIHIEGIYNRHD